MKRQKTGVQRIAAERKRQMAKEGWTADHDDDHECGELALAAACYAVASLEAPNVRVICVEETRQGGSSVRYIGEDAFPWESEADKREKHAYARSLVIAGALIAAELDRLQRTEHGDE